MKLLSNRAYNELKETASLSEERVEELTKELAWAKKGLYDINKLLKEEMKLNQEFKKGLKGKLKNK